VGFFEIIVEFYHLKVFKNGLKLIYFLIHF
jgi:hypothetical protein